MTPSETPLPTRRRWRYFLISLPLFALAVALFYTEENWRGQRAWENCKRQLEAKGVLLNWTNYIPAPVPEDENVFGVPEMQKWFVGRGTNQFSNELSYPGDDWDSRTARLTIAEMTIVLPGTNIPGHNDATMLQWGDPQAKAEADRLIKAALGPVVMAPAGFNLILRQPEKILPAQIFLHCQSAPTDKELLQFLPKPIANTIFPDTEKIQVEPMGNGSYKVTMLAPDTVADFLKWNERFELEFSLIRRALQRPYARMDGDYNSVFDPPIPNFAVVRIISQRLAAMSQCHMILGQPEKALDELAFLHQLCRMLEARPTSKPMTIVAAMIDVAVAGLYVGTIEEGVRLKAWQEPQLAVLEEQLEEINLRPFVTDAFVTEQARNCSTMEMLLKLFNVDWSLSQKLLFSISFDNLMPRGWVYQNMVVCANLQQKVIESLGSADREIVPHKIEATTKEVQQKTAHADWLEFNYLAAICIPDTKRAFQTLVKYQTKANQARIVCALERYRLAHGEYPNTLKMLTPKLIEKIPNDIVGGRPPHYRRNVDGTFLLYSIGWSEQDHGGHAGDTDDSDLVWPEK